MPAPARRLAARARRLQTLPVSDLITVFGSWVKTPVKTGKFRNRLFSASQTFWLFLSQTFSADKSCRETVRRWLAWLAASKRQTASPNTAAYCKARARLPQTMIEKVNDEALRKMEKNKRECELWNGREVKVVDGSSVSMPDTPENQSAYPQSSQQKPGCGFPVMRIVVLFSLATAAAVAVAKGSMKTDERTLFRRLWESLVNGDVLLADRGFCGYADLYLLAQRGVDCVMRKHQSRTTGMRKLRSLGKGDQLVEWFRGSQRPKWIDLDLWRSISPAMILREVTFAVTIPGFRTRSVTVATNLLDPKQYPKQDFADLYRRRWMAELFLRDIKTTMGADVLRCKTPSMVEKELMMFIVAYNLIRALMYEAAVIHGLWQYSISLKGTISTVRQWAPVMAHAPLTKKHLREMKELLLVYLVEDPLPYRPGRWEPRAIKRRPKPFSFRSRSRPNCLSRIASPGS